MVTMWVAANDIVQKFPFQTEVLQSHHSEQLTEADMSHV